MIFLHRASALSTGIKAGDLEVEQEVLLNENGAPANYLVVHQGLPSDLYDASCEGTWLLRKDIAENGEWNASEVNTLVGADIMTTMQGYLDKFDSQVQTAIKTVKIPYCVGGADTTVNSGANGLECKIFPLSSYEVGFTTSVNQYFPISGSVLSYFQGTNIVDAKRIGNLNGNAAKWWLRDSTTSGTRDAWYVNSNGSYGGYNTKNSCGVRHALIIPYDFTFQESEVAA